MKGHFTIQNTRGSCSNAAIDHAHEQKNFTINGEEGAIGLFEDDKALRRWMVADLENIDTRVDQFIVI